MGDVKRYAAMKDSGVEWIGEIPQHWNIQRGKNILRLLSREVLKDDDVVTCFRDGEVTLRKNRREAGFTNALQEIGYQGVDVGDLIVHGMDGFAGAIGISDSRGKSSPVLNVLDSMENKRFLMYYLRALAFKDVFMALSTGIRIRSCDLRWNKLAILPFLLPPLPEQQAIADYLDKQCSAIDDIIASAKTSIEDYKQLKASTIYEAVTKGLNPDVEMKDSGVEWIGEVPKGWTLRRVKSISRVLRGASPRPIDNPIYFSDCGEYVWTRIADVSAMAGKFFQKRHEYMSDLGSSLSVKLEPGSLFLSICASVGKPIITKVKCCIHDGFVYFPELLSSSRDYLFYIFLCGECFKGLGKMGTQLNLNTQTVGNISIPIPPLPEQQAIADYLDTRCAQIDELIAAKEAFISDLEAYKKSLIYECVTGKRKVTDDPIEPKNAAPAVPATPVSSKPEQLSLI